MVSVNVAFAEIVPAAQRIRQRTFPSIFQAWNGAAPTPGQDADAMLAKHDLVFLHPSMLGLVAEGKNEGMAHTFTSASVAQAKARRADLLRRNPNLVLLAEVRYRDAPKGFLPDDSPYWKRDADGQFVLGWAEGGYRLLDVESIDWQTQVANHAKALQATAIFDGVMLDWWSDDDAHVSLARRVREAIGPDGLILVNSNDREIPRTAPCVNGLFMECFRSATPEDWRRITGTLRWADANLRTPRINCVETWFHQSRNDLSLMRAVTTLTLTQSDGYCLFSDPNGLSTPDHLHDWYSFWDRGLGKPMSAGRQRPDAAWEREYSGGTVIYNPPGNPGVHVKFKRPHRSRATGKVGDEHAIASGDGDILLTE
ncbi:MAG TPA: hypothetical protein VK327_07945 [Candidatus Paceibacterota bacterium]|nr:hypothetical protein [Candidatus Paceibacterota bacterium]